MKGLWTYIRLTQSKAWIWQCLAIALVAVLLFLPLLNGGLCLFSTDNNIGDTARTKAFFPHGFLGIWGDSVLLGSAGVAGGNWLTAMMWLMPLRGYVNWFHAVDLGLAALGLTWFLRLKRCSWLACMPAWLAAFWVGSNFTLVYAGHIGKYGVLLFAVLALGCIEKAFQTRRIAWGVLTGGALGLMLLEQPDLAMFFGLAIAGYGLFSLLVRAKDARIWKFACLLLPAMALPLLLIAGQSLVGSYTANVSAVSYTHLTLPTKRIV